MNIMLRSNDTRYYLGKLYNEENESLLSNTQISVNVKPRALDN